MPYSQPITEIVKKRFSCRTYLKQPIKEAQRRPLDALVSLIKTGPLGASARFKLLVATPEDHKALKGLGTYGFIKGATGFIVGAVGPGARNLEDYGYVMEQIILLATDLGLGTCWLGGTFSRSSFANKIALKEGERLPAVTSLGYIAEKPRLMDKLIRRSAHADKRWPWERLFFEGDLRRPLSREAAGVYAVPLDMLRLGPSASNKQPWRVVKDGRVWHFYLQRNKNYDRIFDLVKMEDFQRVDMGIAMSHFELTANELALPGRWRVDEPDLPKPDELTEYSISWIEGQGEGDG